MSYFDTTVFNRIAMQQKETNDLLRELIKTLQEQKSNPTQNFEPPTQTYVPPVFYKPVPQPPWPGQPPYTITCSAEQATQPQRPEGDLVAYLDAGANGYLDLMSELSECALQQLPKGLPKGCTPLVTAGTYGVDSYVTTPQPAPKAQVGCFGHTPIPTKTAKLNTKKYLNL